MADHSKSVNHHGDNFGNAFYGSTFHAPVTMSPEQRETVKTCLRAILRTLPEEPKATMRNFRMFKEYDKYIKDTCAWFPELGVYKKWLDEDRGLMWIFSGPGTGKTALALRLVERLSSVHGDIVLYFFCDPASEITGSTILRSLLYQLLQRDNKLYEHLQELYEDKGDYLFKDSNTEEVWDLFRVMLQAKYDVPVRVIIDGLDQCDTKSLKSFLHNLKTSLLKGRSGDTSEEVQSCSPFGVIVLSRSEPHILARELRSFPNIHELPLDEDGSCSHGRKQDIALFIERKIERIASPQSQDWSDDLRSEIHRVLEEKAGGIFLWVAFVLSDMEEMVSHEVEDALTKLPTALQDIYKDILSQIQRRHQETAAKILRWITCARRPLNLWELAEITAVQPARGDPSPIKAIKEQVRLCKSFVVIYMDGKQEFARLYHDSAKDFLGDHEALLNNDSLFTISMRPKPTPA